MTNTTTPPQSSNIDARLPSPWSKKTKNINEPTKNINNPTVTIIDRNVSLVICSHPLLFLL